MSEKEEKQELNQFSIIKKPLPSSVDPTAFGRHAGFVFENISIPSRDRIISSENGAIVYAPENASEEKRLESLMAFSVALTGKDGMALKADGSPKNSWKIMRFFLLPP